MGLYGGLYPHRVEEAAQRLGPISLQKRRTTKVWGLNEAVVPVAYLRILFPVKLA